MKRVTIKDIARKLGIAYSTVSMAINDDENISKETKEKVKKAIIELGYYPNKAARTLVKGKTNNIAVVAPGFFSLYELHIIKGMEEKLKKSKYDIVLYTGRYDYYETHNILNKILFEKNADAVIVIGVMLKEEIMEEYKKLAVPLILIDSCQTEKGYVINVDNYYAGKLAAEYFLKLNKKRPAILLGSTQYAYSQQERKQGYIMTLKDNNIIIKDNMIFESFDYLPDDLKRFGKKASETLLKEKTDAVFCANGDYAAFGVYKYLTSKGVKIPDDVSIVGCDNFDVAEIMEFTTIEQPLAEIGRFAFEIAETMQTKKISYKIKKFKPELIIRKT